MDEESSPRVSPVSNLQSTTSSDSISSARDVADSTSLANSSQVRTEELADNTLEISEIIERTESVAPSENLTHTGSAESSLHDAAATPPVLQQPMVGVPLQPRWKQFTGILLLSLASVTWLVATICFAFLSASSPPLISFASPGLNIFLIQVGTTISVFLLGEIVSETFDIFRWHRAADPQVGLGMATFFALGRATSLSGVIRLLCSNLKAGHRIWCLQRYPIPRLC